MHVRCPALLSEERGVDRAEAVLVARRHRGEPTPRSTGAQGGRRTGSPQRPRLWGVASRPREAPTWPRRAATARAWTGRCRPSSARSTSTAPPIYVRKEIVHNKHVVEQLRERGAIFVEEETEVPEGETVVFSAHGVAPGVHANSELRQLRTIDATCPLVTKVHVEARKFAAEGYTIVLVGHAGPRGGRGHHGRGARAHRAGREHRGRRRGSRSTIRTASPTSPRPRSRSTRRATSSSGCASVSRTSPVRAPTTSATPPPTARWPSARWRASAISCS